MSFVEQQDVFDTIQPVIQGVFEEFGGGRKVDTEWPQISYRDAALKWYGTDKPDLRNPIKMQDRGPSISQAPALRSLPRSWSRTARKSAPSRPRWRLAQVLRPDERFRAERGAAGDGIYLLARSGRGHGSRRAAWPRISAPSEPRRSASSLVLASAMRRSSLAVSRKPLKRRRQGAARRRDRRMS